MTLDTALNPDRLRVCPLEMAEGLVKNKKYSVAPLLGLIIICHRFFRGGEGVRV